MASAISWFQIPASDVTRAKQFYETVCGFRLEPLPASPGMDMWGFPADWENGEVSGALVRGEGAVPSATGTTPTERRRDTAPSRPRRGRRPTHPRLGQRYAQYFNRRHERTGGLFEGRYYSCLVGEEPYLFACYRYIELDPVRAGIVAHPGGQEGGCPGVGI